jgi:Fungal protein kinase
VSVSGSNSGSSKLRKRPADGSSTTNKRPEKKAKTKTKTKTKTKSTLDWDSLSTQKLEAKCQVDPALQICRYLLEMFSVPLLRSHATVSLVDRERLQLYHANHSVILVSSAIDFSEASGRDKFIATIIAFYCLTLEQNGVLTTIFSKNAELVRDPHIAADDRVVQKGNKLEFSGEQGDFVVEVVDIISRDPSVVGRSTAVVDVTSDQSSQTELVLKASWPSSTRVSEAVFLKKASEAAEKTPDNWATKHLPRVYRTIDKDFDPDSTPELVALLFDKAEIVNGKFKYERRTLRIILQERLNHLKTLRNVRDIGQVFLDVACSACASVSAVRMRSRLPSSPLALGRGWDSPPRPQSQQHHVSPRRRNEQKYGKA